MQLLQVSFEELGSALSSSSVAEESPQDLSVCLPPAVEEGGSCFVLILWGSGSCLLGGSEWGWVWVAWSAFSKPW